MTTVFPAPVAIFEQTRPNSPPSDGTSMPTLAGAGASVSQIRVSTASNWQKKKRRFSYSCGSVQWRSNSPVTAETPGQPASRHALTRSRMASTRGISTKTPGSSKERESRVATTYPARRRPDSRVKPRLVRS